MLHNVCMVLIHRESRVALWSCFIAGHQDLPALYERGVSQCISLILIAVRDELRRGPSCGTYVYLGILVGGVMHAS
jgi:hypothetical protein